MRNPPLHPDTALPLPSIANLHGSDLHGKSDRSDKLKLTSTGSGGLAELRDQLDDSRASYGYVRVQYSNDKESVREKFILVIWIGPDCKVMRKAKVCVSSWHATCGPLVLSTS